MLIYFANFSSDLSVQDTKDSKHVLKEAFKASEAEQILRVVDIHEMHGANQVDQLSTITYLNLMRNHRVGCIINDQTTIVTSASQTD